MIVYKYRGGDNEIFKRDLDALKNDFFWASSVAQLNDPCETIIDTDHFKNQIRRILKILKQDTPQINERYRLLCNALDDIINRDIGIFSLSKTNLDELLWAHYANSHKGFCIAFDLEKLTENNSIIKYYPFHVTYSDTPPRVSVLDMNKLREDLTKSSLIKKFTSIKSKRWINEQEVRIITDKWGRQPYDYRALKSIYFGMRMSDTDKDQIMYELRGRGITYYQIYLEDKSYKFNHNLVQDKFPDCEQYLSKQASVSESAVIESDVKEENKKYIPFLYDAIELAKREPYCEEIYYSEFSSTKSTKDNPVIFVNCKKSNNDYVNYYYTIDEIIEKLKAIRNK